MIAIVVMMYLFVSLGCFSKLVEKFDLHWLALAIASLLWPIIALINLGGAIT